MEDNSTYSSSHGGQLSIGIVGRRDFDNVGSDQVDTFETTDDSAELTGSPTTSLGSTSSRGDYSNKSDTLNSFTTEVNLQAGSSVSISILRYTGFVVPTLSLIFLMIPSVPILSTSLASTISKPQ
jgi:hypothetical protein